MISEAKKIANKKWREKNKERIKIYQREYIKKYQKEWRKKNPEAAKARDKKYNAKRLNDPIKRKKFYDLVKKYQSSKKGQATKKRNMNEWLNKILDNGMTNRERLALKAKEIRISNPEKFKLYEKKRSEKIKKDPSKLKKRRKTINKWTNEKRKTDIFFKIRGTLSARLGQFLKKKGTKKAASINYLIGCSKKELILHLEKKFYPHPKTGEIMNWHNHKLVGG